MSDTGLPRDKMWNLSTHLLGLVLVLPRVLAVANLVAVSTLTIHRDLLKTIISLGTSDNYVEWAMSGVIMSSKHPLTMLTWL